MMKLMVSGMKVPEPTPPRNCIGQEGIEVRRQRPEQAGGEEQHDAEQQHAPHAEHRAEIGRGDADQHLADAEARGDPGAFVEAGRQAAAQIGQPEGGDPAAERAHVEPSSTPSMPI